MYAARHAGRVNEHGQLFLTDPSAWRADLARQRNRDVWVTVMRQSTAHTTSQRKYYHGVVCRCVGECIGESADDAHGLLKQEILGKRDAELLDGRHIQMPPTTRFMTVEEFSDYIERCKRWAASFLGLSIPDPGEVEVL